MTHGGHQEGLTTICLFFRKFWTNIEFFPIYPLFCLDSVRNRFNELDDLHEEIRQDQDYRPSSGGHSLAEFRCLRKFKTIVHHLVAIAWLSLGVFGKTHVCFISVGELLQIGIFFFHLRRLVALSGFQRNGLFYWSITKLRNVSFIGIRSAVFFWIQWQVFQHREDIEDNLVLLGRNSFFDDCGHNCIVKFHMVIAICLNLKLWIHKNFASQLLGH